MSSKYCRRSLQIIEIADMLQITLERLPWLSDEFQEDTFVEDPDCPFSEDSTSDDSAVVEPSDINFFEDDLNESNLFKCSTCNKGFTSRFALKQHKAKHGDNSSASNYRNHDEDEETQNGIIHKIREDYVGEWCPKCNELMLRTVLAQHLKECDGNYVDPDAETDIERLSDDEDEAEALTRSQDVIENIALEAGSPIPSTSTSPH